MKAEMIKLLSEISLGLFAATNLARPIVGELVPGSSVYDWISRFGALGLCAFMVFQNYRQSDAMTKILASKDKMIADKDNQIVQLTRDVLAAMHRNTEAIGSITEALRSRPCIIGDTRLDKQQGD